jgi:hypothetical protein
VYGLPTLSHTGFASLIRSPPRLSRGLVRAPGARRAVAASGQEAGRADARGLLQPGAAAGPGLLIVGRILGHTDTKITPRYAHLVDEPVRAATERIGGEIAGALHGELIQVRPRGKRRT